MIAVANLCTLCSMKRGKILFTCYKLISAHHFHQLLDNAYLKDTVQTYRTSTIHSQCILNYSQLHKKIQTINIFQSDQPIQLSEPPKFPR